MTSSKKRFKVAGIGEVLWDVYQDQRYVGGAPASFAVHAAQLGEQSYLISRVGDDGMGNELIRKLTEYQISTDHVQVDKKKGTGTVLVSLDIKGEPAFHCSNDVAFDYLSFDTESTVLASELDAVVFDSLGQRQSQARNTIYRFLESAPKAVKIYDVNSRMKEAVIAPIVKKSLALSNGLKANAGEFELLKRVLRKDGETTEKFADILRADYDLDLVIVTYGPEGSWIFTDAGDYRGAAARIKVVDATGAGDAFLAGAVYKFLRKADLQDMVEFANLMGAFVCTQKGGTLKYRLEDLLAFEAQLENHKGS